MDDDQAKKLRAPFDPKQIGKLPKPTRKDAQKGKCPECGGWHGLPAVHLDYVGHAATTDRLLQVDPEWTWEPVAVGPNGEPLIVNGGLWIRLTVAGVTRIGFGDGASMKECIGDAIRNAAMRFGVALDLWAKEDLSNDDASANSTEAPKAPAAPSESGVDAGDAGSGMVVQPSAASPGHSTRVAPAQNAGAVPATVTLRDDTLFPTLGTLEVQIVDKAVEGGVDKAVVTKSIADASAKRPDDVEYRKWLERQLKTVEKRLEEQRATADSPFQAPEPKAA